MKQVVSVRITLFILSLVIGLSLFVWLISRQGLGEVVENIYQFGIWPFIGFVLISFLNFGFYSLRWQLIVNRLVSETRRIPFYRVYLHRMGGYAMSYLTPAAQVGGEPVRIALLASDKANTRESTSSVVLDIAFELVAYVLFILAGVIFAIVEGFASGSSLWIMLGGLLALLLLLTLFLHTLARGSGFFSKLFRFTKLDRVKSLQSFEKAILDSERIMQEFLTRNKKLVGAVSVLSILGISFRIVETFYIAHFFDVSLSFSQAFLLSTLPGVALLLPVPAGLGVFEGSFAAIFALLAVPLSPVAFALIIRGRDLVFIVIGVIHIFMHGSTFLRKKIVEPVLVN